MQGETYRRRRSRPQAPRRGRSIDPRLVPLAAGALLAVVLLLVGFPFVAGRLRSARQHTPAVHLTAVPADAKLVLGSKAGTGALEFASLPAGRYTLTATRKGFRPLRATVVVRDNVAVAQTFTLEPLPQAVKLTSHQKGARFTVTRSDGRTESAQGTFTAQLPAGPTTISLSAPGFPAYSRKLFLDAPLDLDVWLDPKGQLVHTVSVFKCVPAPKGVAVSPDGSQLWVTALVTQPSVEAYDRSGKVIGKVDLGKSGAVEVTFNADGSRAYASQMQSASVFEIDTKTFKVLRTFKTKSSWTKVVSLSADGKKLYAANWSGDDVSEIDLATGACTRRFPTVDTPRGLYPTADGKQLYVAGFGEQSLTGRIAIIDLATGKSRTIFSIKGGAMRHMVADEKRGVVFTSDMGKALIWETDMRTGETRRFAKTDSHPNTIDLSPDGKVLFVSCRGRNNPKSYYVPGPEWGSILLIDATTGKPLDVIVGGNQCTALDLSGDGRTLVFSDFLDNRLRVYDIPAYSSLAKGNGGRYEAHFADVKKAGWSSGEGGGSGGSGD